MRSWIAARHVFSSPLPADLGEDLRLSEAVLETLIEAFSAPGDTVFDPFAGFGTTLLVAERLGRAGWGVERCPRRAAHGRSLFANPARLLTGDIRATDLAGLPAPRLTLTSPIYMHRHETADPLSGFRSEGQYGAYLAELGRIFRRIAAISAPGGRLVVEAANLTGPEGHTPFAWDLARAVAAPGGPTLAREIVLVWDRYGHGTDHSYAHVFDTARAAGQAAPATEPN
ncbi:MAG: DNA methyltransferase [Paracoccaceae bacterium]